MHTHQKLRRGVNSFIVNAMTQIEGDFLQEKPVAQMAEWCSANTLVGDSTQVNTFPQISHDSLS